MDAMTEWKHAFFEIDPSRARIEDLDPDWSTSHAYSRQEMSEWTRQLREVQRLQREEGYAGPDFARLETSPLPSDRQLARTYRGYYGDGTGPGSPDCIRVEWLNDHFEVTNGRHRIALAREQGLPTVPASVAAPDQATLDRLRAEGEERYRAPDQWRRERSAERSQSR
jgi:hypothetical protein